MSSSKETVCNDQIAIVDGLGITHFIPRRLTAEMASAKRQKRKSG